MPTFLIRQAPEDALQYVTLGRGLTGIADSDLAIKFFRYYLCSAAAERGV